MRSKREKKSITKSIKLSPLQVQQIEEKAKEKNLVEALSKRGSINIEKGKAYYQQAESLLLQASELTKHFPNNMLKANIASSLSALYSRMQKGKEAIKYAKENFTHLTDTTLYAKGYLLLGDAYYKAQFSDSEPCLCSNETESEAQLLHLQEVPPSSPRLR